MNKSEIEAIRELKEYCKYCVFLLCKECLGHKKDSDWAGCIHGNVWPPKTVKVNWRRLY